MIVIATFMIANEGIIATFMIANVLLLLLKLDLVVKMKITYFADTYEKTS